MAVRKRTLTGYFIRKLIHIDANGLVYWDLSIGAFFASDRQAYSQ